MTNMFEASILAISFVAVASLFLACRLIWMLRREKVTARKRLFEDLTERDDQGVTTHLRFVSALHRLGDLLAGSGYSHNLRQKLSGAGFHGPAAPAVFMGAKALLFAGGVVAGALVAMQASFPLHVAAGIVLLVSAPLFFAPNMFLAQRRAKRKAETTRYLPDATDLLEICVSSGMALDMAWNAVAAEMRRVSSVLADEMELTQLEISLGVERSAAMRKMAERTGAEEISSLVAMMVQADRFGASIVDALRTFASSMRDVSSRKAEEAAEKMAVKLLAPMVLFIFPALLIVMVGPAVMRIVDTMGT